MLDRHAGKYSLYLWPLSLRALLNRDTDTPWGRGQRCRMGYKATVCERLRCKIYQCQGITRSMAVHTVSVYYSTVIFNITRDFDDWLRGHEDNLRENKASIACRRGRKFWPRGHFGLEDLTSLSTSSSKSSELKDLVTAFSYTLHRNHQAYSTSLLNNKLYSWTE